MGATSTADSRMAGQAVRVPELPEGLRPHTARVAMCAGPDPAWPLPGGSAASGKWLPYSGPWIFHLRMEGLSPAGGWAGWPWTRDRGEGHVSCSFQLRLCGHELVSETVPRLG